MKYQITTKTKRSTNKKHCFRTVYLPIFQHRNFMFFFSLHSTSYAKGKKIIRSGSVPFLFYAERHHQLVRTGDVRT